MEITKYDAATYPDMLVFKLLNKFKDLRVLNDRIIKLR